MQTMIGDLPARSADLYVRPLPLPTAGTHRSLIRVVDWAAAAFGLLLLAPVFLLVALLVKLADGGPVMFAQRRVGSGGRLFSCYKFRTMRVDAEARLAEVLRADPIARAEWHQHHKLRRDPRIVGFGRLLRKTSLDELPQLFNVLRGDMSLVGPRPIVPAEMVRYGRHLAAYCSVRPGVTGLWQVSGRTECSYRRRVANDVLFARRLSFALYLTILARTVPTVLFVRGSY